MAPTTAEHHGIRPELAALATPVDHLTPHPDNPNDGDADAIAESLRTHGQYRPIVVWQRGPDEPGVILAGNTTYAAALSLGWTHIAVTPVVADTAEEATRILLADNRYAQLARMNDAALVDLLQGLPDLAGTGYTFDDLDDLLAQADAVAVLPVAPTDADYNEHPDETEARAQRGTGTRAGAGLREALHVLPAEDHDELMRLYARLREVMGDQPQGVLGLRAARMAVAVLDGGSGHPAGHDCSWCQIAREAGAGA